MQSPGLQDVLKEVAECASAYSINLDGRVTRQLAIYRKGDVAVYKGTLEPERSMVAVKTVIIPWAFQQLDAYKNDIKVRLSPLPTIC